MNKKLFVLFFMVMALLGNLSCSKDSEDEDGSASLSVKVSPDKAFILPLEDMTKCSIAAYLSSNVIEFNSIALTWSASTAFRLVSMTLEVKHPSLQGGSYQCPIAGNELTALMPYRTIASNCQGTACTLTSSNSCSMRCGGIKLVTGATSATMPGKIKILAIETDADNNAFPITKEVDITVMYKKF